MRNLFIVTAIGAFVLMIITFILNFMPLYLLCSVVLLWSLLLVLIYWLEPKIKKANELFDNKLDSKEWDNYYPDQEF